MPAETINNELGNMVQRAEALLANGKLQEAVNIANRLFKTYRHKPQVWSLFCNINLAQRNYDNAIANAGKVVELAPENIRSYLLLAMVYISAGKNSQSLPELEKAVSFNPGEASLNDMIGTMYSLCDETEKALVYSRRAVDKEPDSSFYRSNLALIQRMTGDMDGAEANFNQVIKSDPHNYQAYYARADLKTWTVENNHIAQMKDLLLSGTTNWRGEISLRFAIAKECEDIGSYAEQFRFIKSACDLQRRHTRYDVSDDIEAIDRIIDVYTKDTMARIGPGNASTEPIFVLGLPRTGTSLVDRIIGNHSKVYSAGELNNFSSVLVKAIQEKSGAAKMKMTEMIDRSVATDVTLLGDNYIESTRPKAGHTPHFIDKLPLNYLYCGIIHAALPNAKIVLLERDPLDACFAIYKTMFIGIYPFSYDLKELAGYYLAYRRLVEHWRNVLGDALYCVAYEDIVENTEAEVRKLLEYCNLGCEPQCIEFHNNPAPATTASAVQVRQPIYQSSVGKWKHYRDELGPLINIFEQNGIVNGDR